MSKSKQIINIASILERDKPGEKVAVNGWVRTKRESSNVAFVAINDGSTINNLQAVLEVEQFEESELKRISTGASVRFEGILTASPGGQQNIELAVEDLQILGDADPEEYPLQPKKHSLEFLREHAHLRFRTNTFGAVFRIRHKITFAIHAYFHKNGFYNLHTPIITASDAEGAGEMFRVSAFDFANLPTDEKGKVDFEQDFFGKETHLTVSGQLQAELAAMALGKVYTFGPTFRAENSNTTRHLAEFWMIEPEMAFYNLEDNMDLAEDFLKSVISTVIHECESDLNFLAKREQEEEKNKKQEDRHELNLVERLKKIVAEPFERMDYGEAIAILENSKPNKKKKFSFPVKWGMDLQSEHERYLVEKHVKRPVILYNYPKEVKAFYMRQNDDGKTVAAMDVLFPGIGEIIGGSQREERLGHLKSRMQELSIPEKSMWWYLETRKFGSAIHSGFGLGLERLVQFTTGMGNIRDVIPFPRTPKNVEF